MTKQQEIREGIEKVICSCCDDIGDWKEGQTLAEAQEYCRKKAICAYCTDLREAIQKYEHSEGVVIRVKRELPLVSEADVNEWSRRGIPQYYQDTLSPLQRY